MTTAYTWDAEDRLVAVVMGNQRSEFTYDGFSRRVKIEEGTYSGGVFTPTTSLTKKFIWVGGTIAEERNNSDVVQKKFYGFGEWRTGVGNLYYARDHLGNLRELTDNSNVVRARYEYDPYGRRTKVSGDLEADWGFTGHYYHAPSTLHLAWFRSYDANLGRWISRDPIMERGGLNLYGYVGGNPINGRDSLGLSDDDDLDERLKYLENGGGIGKATYAQDDETKAQHDEIMEKGKDDLKEAGKTLLEEAAWACVPFGAFGKFGGKFLKKKPGKFGEFKSVLRKFLQPARKQVHASEIAGVGFVADELDFQRQAGRHEFRSSGHRHGGSA